MGEDTTALINLADIRSALQDLQQEHNREATLVILTGPQTGELYKIENGETIIGRDLSCNIVIADNGISRRHASITRNNDSIILKDLKSTNGTYRNGEQLASRELEDGDRLQLGTNVILKFSWQDKLESAYQEKLFNSATKDGLTGVFNKKYLEEHLTTEFSYALRHNSLLSLVIFDIDHFKQVNDTYGHMAGDEVLRTLARIVSQTLRAEDLFARYGGEEFVVLIRDATPEQAYLAAERIRKAVEKKQFSYNGTVIPVTISMGIHTVINGQPASARELVMKADEYLYKAKSSGRNITCSIFTDNGQPQ